VADWSGIVRRYSATGTLLHTLSVFGAQFSDIDISPDGKIALGTGLNGEVVVTDLALDSFTRFRVTDTDGV